MGDAALLLHSIPRFLCVMQKKDRLFQMPVLFKRICRKKIV